MIALLKGCLVFILFMLVLVVFAMLLVDIYIYMNVRKWCRHCFWDVVIDIECLIGLVLCIFTVLFLF